MVPRLESFHAMGHESSEGHIHREDRPFDLVERVAGPVDGFDGVALAAPTAVHADPDFYLHSRRQCHVRCYTRAVEEHVALHAIDAHEAKVLLVPEHLDRRRNKSLGQCLRHASRGVHYGSHALPGLLQPRELGEGVRPHLGRNAIRAVGAAHAHLGHFCTIPVLPIARIIKEEHVAKINLRLLLEVVEMCNFVAREDLLVL
mmetsp:Transcript_624/g.1952  ORF Transcript_624/g.1952 Transcript_624/m.1952 type:complete len:202 (+) Transcript_624:374-979(+)